MRTGVVFALSIALHALLLFQHVREIPVPESPPVEIVAAPPPPQAPAKRARRGGRGGRRPIPAERLAVVAPGEGPTIGAFRTGGGIGSSGAGDGNSSEEGLRQLGVTSRLYEIIDQAIDYPAAITDRGDEGIIKARLVFEPDGRYNRERSAFTGSSNLLRVHVIRTIRRTLTESIGKRDKSLTVRCNFEFRIHGGPIARRQSVGITDTAPGPSGAHLDARDNLLHSVGTPTSSGNYLYFYRQHNAWTAVYVDTIHDDRARNNLTAGRLDLMPLIEKGVDAIGDLLAPKAKRDPLDDYREDPEWATSQ